MIDSATNSVEFLQLEYHEDGATELITRRLEACRKRGVKVEGLVDARPEFNKPAVSNLKARSIDIALSSNPGMLHCKIFLVDRRKLLLGSTNLSGNSMYNNNETNIFVDDPDIGRCFHAYIQSVINGREPPPPETTLDAGPKPVFDRSHFEVIHHLLENTQSNVFVVMYGIKRYPDKTGSKTERLLLDLIEAAARGVDVRVILDQSDYNKVLNEINALTASYLRENGVMVRADPIDVTTHAKLVICDDHVLVGSANWGYSAMEKRHEASLLSKKPSTANDFRAYFNELWSNSRDWTDTPANSPRVNAENDPSTPVGKQP